MTITVSARPTSAAKRNCATGRAAQTSTASKTSTQSNAIVDAVDQTSARPILESQRNHGSGRADHTSTAPTTAAQSNIGTGVVDGPFLADRVLGTLAFAVDELEHVRCAAENRLLALTSVYGMTLDDPTVRSLESIAFVLHQQEDKAILDMNRRVRKHPLWPFMKPILGVGEKQFARLLALLGDPYWNDKYDRPRTMRELRAYCGWHVIDQGHADKNGTESKPHSVGVAPRRQRGQQSNWNDEARKRTWLIAQSCMKQRNSTYRVVYDEARMKYADSVHTTPCVRCGPKGSPAPVGSPRSAGHQNAMALRKVAVAFLADLWTESKRLHEEKIITNTEEK